jgi:hypothetical protein
MERGSGAEDLCRNEQYTNSRESAQHGAPLVIVELRVDPMEEVKFRLDRRIGQQRRRSRSGDEALSGASVRILGQHAQSSRS